MTSENAQDGERYVFFPDAELCEESGCAFFEYDDSGTAHCRNRKMSGTVLKEKVEEGEDACMACPHRGTRADRRRQEKNKRRKW